MNTAIRRLTALASALVMAVGLMLAVSPVHASAEVETTATALCSTTLRYGSSGTCVKKLQTRLNELGLNCGNKLTVDGKFGPATRMRVFAFQGRNRIAVDGVVGPITRGKLANPDSNLKVSCDSTIAAQIRSVWPASLEDKAIRVARCESGLNPIAVGVNTNGTKDMGVFQFNTGGTLQEWLPGSSTKIKIDNALTSTENIKAAYRLYKSRGWQPWTCRNA
ncbi:putative peptidoglycan binding protein [Stackebrandtia albiflava]|uniref:Putative peptidoglycan binding protein n=1 Tax=Stackebrandtia albiflava TaxID=406432 RepID=A0A562V392_9ACTN|nr:peptidoglycan-binding protein [Stackebrandtia albiflava]TWJ12344.1 putative peptidoglycan binding protein [Stackebrandtia albiflava]